MADRKRKRPRGGKRKGRRSTPLSGHKQEKKRLLPPFLTYPNLKPVSWVQDSLPDFIWIQAVREHTGDLADLNEVLDLLDQFAPKPEPSPADPAPEGESATSGAERPVHPNILDGRISNFALIPPERRNAAVAAVREHMPWALPDGFGHALALYPECPAGWLYQDWDDEPDPERGSSYLKQVVEPLLDPRGRPSSQVRQIPLARLGKHGKIKLVRDLPVAKLLPLYPSGLSEADQLHVEQWGRNMMNIQSTISDRTVADAWCHYFWARSREVSPCEEPPAVAVDDEEPVAEPGTAPQIGDVAAVRDRIVGAIDQLGLDLDRAQQELPLDLFDPVADEVKLGLASRTFRLLRRLAENPRSWTNEMGPHLLRPMVETRIISAWLLQQNDPALYRKFQEYGLGKRKLFKLKLEELMDREGFDEDDEMLHERLSAEVNSELIEEMISIDVGGTFSGKDIRMMARAAGLGELYALTYQPLSTELHGEWGSLVEFDLRHCGNPLHRFHRVGRFDTSDEAWIHLGWVRDSFGLAEDTISNLFASYDVDVRELFAGCLRRIGEGAKRADDPSHG